MSPASCLQAREIASHRRDHVHVRIPGVFVTGESFVSGRLALNSNAAVALNLSARAAVGVFAVGEAIEDLVAVEISVVRHQARVVGVDAAAGPNDDELALVAQILLFAIDDGFHKVPERHVELAAVYVEGIHSVFSGWFGRGLGSCGTNSSASTRGCRVCGVS